MTNTLFLAFSLASVFSNATEAIGLPLLTIKVLLFIILTSAKSPTSGRIPAPLIHSGKHPRAVSLLGAQLQVSMDVMMKIMKL
ncbi:hypothetical protein EUV02_12910 [Polymorphobacter arshaanensis]|uniref:Uncharacterized protein n=1 Tax=Glacieibacterium arshaanense TaxID=2511025 RepID=A0A4Y9EKY5_9SPHN|nr:hypothetical protein [Polymorphobacter arshaanensis]TFU01199.1 hypothetical protein EUV02_12910 [Polymorphobacter arshaanensis]